MLINEAYFNIVWERNNDIKKHKTRTVIIIYCILLLLLVGYISFVFFFTTITGVIAYYQYIACSIFFLIFGIPILLFGIFFSTIMIKESIQSLPTYFIEHKIKLTKKGKKGLKNILFSVASGILVGLIGFLFTVAGVVAAIDSIHDYSYLNSPVSVELYETTILYQRASRRSDTTSSYHLYGHDQDGEKYDFRIGKHLEAVLPKQQINYLTVYYLPNSKVVMEIK